jgi:hypoxanthine phosphoribosyltransferase
MPPRRPKGGRLRTLISQQELERRVSELAREIDRHYLPGRPASDPLVCIGVLKGSVFFVSDLLKEMRTPLAVDFFQTSSYGGNGASRGELRIKKDIDLSVAGRDVLLIEDIVDTGYTLRTILDLFRFRGARSVRLCALLDKTSAREVQVPIDYCGFPIENAFVVGYGLDYDERFRNLPYIGIYGEDEPEPEPQT